MKKENYLLQEYSKSLERENQAKNNETTMLYNKIRDLNIDNEKSKNAMSELQEKIDRIQQELV